jgi:endonuclease YncB( thermonuclease family)
MRLTLRSLLVLWALCALFPPIPALADMVEGRARVIDGDTLDIAGTKLRLHGVDAPELDQTCQGAGGDWPCGAFARDMLAGIVGEGKLSCDVQEVDRYGRGVAVCLRDRTDVAARLVRDGGATAYLRYSDRYAPAERAARSEGLGIWSGGLTMPEAWRHAQDGAATAGAVTGDCLIKGNVGSGGRRVYHLPGQADYDATRINPRKGEAYFCTEAEARAAGFRRAKR